MILEVFSQIQILWSSHRVELLALKSFSVYQRGAYIFLKIVYVLTGKPKSKDMVIPCEKLLLIYFRFFKKKGGVYNDKIYL